MNHQKIIEKIKRVDKMVDQKNEEEKGYEAIERGLERIATGLENGIVYGFGIPATILVILWGVDTFFRSSK